MAGETDYAVKPTKEWDELYWAYNFPVQMWKTDDGEHSVVNYMPRKETCCTMETRVTAKELPVFCENAAKRLRNLALLFEALGRGDIDTIYYPDETVAETIADRDNN